MPNSTAPVKPKKPSRDFPLFAHATGRWAKKIRGKTHYFGPWADPDGALQKWLDQKDDLLAGRTPPDDTDGLTVGALCNRFMASKQAFVDSGDLSPRTRRIYEDVCGKVVDGLGARRLVTDLRPDDFQKLRAKFSSALGPAALQVAITCTRSLFKYGYDAMLIDAPIRFGPDFKGSSKRAKIEARNKNGARMFSAEEIHRLLAEADVQMRCLVLLGVQGGFGNMDLATLKLSALDLEGGWVNHPRPKTGVARRCPLMPETIDALRKWLEVRPDPKEEGCENLVFLSTAGGPLRRIHSNGRETDALSSRFRRLRNKVGVSREGFYTFRRVAETVLGESADQVAVDYIMGHVTPGMGTVYRQGISDDRLRVAVEHVRKWLFGSKDPE